MNAKQLALAAMRLDRAARTAYLDEACGGDEALKAEALAALEACEAEEVSTFAAVGPVDDALGTIGPYELVRRIGEGGMGVVYHARQHQPIRRDVALKVIKPGMDSAQVIARFESERLALGLMDHPNIARVLDAGTTPRGLPYFVMELVDGVPITSYCDTRQLGVRERIELLIPVIKAIQHAHQKGIIHRDIKPSNVLVKQQDGVALPKVIDFGLAKALANPLTGQATLTQLGSVMGTLDYMSPEQAEPGRQDVDTRTDIYSLGALMHELLTGVVPVEHDLSSKASFLEVLERVRNTPVPSPSDRLKQSSRTPEFAGRRGTDGPHLARLLTGELDWILLKALEKDRTRRYETANGLARDLERFLAGEPVEAGPPSARYRLGKFARKHRLSLGFAATVVLLLASFSVALALQNRRVVLERDRANHEAETAGQVVRFMVEMFRAADPAQARGKTVTARDIVDLGAQRLETELKGQPQVQATLQEAVGDVYQQLGLYDRAKPLLEESLRRRRELLGESSLETARSLHMLAVLSRTRGDDVAAVQYARQALERRTALFGERHPDTAASINELAEALRVSRRFAEAGPLYRRALEVRRELFGELHGDVAQSLNNLALYLYERHVLEGTSLENSEELYRRALEVRRSVNGPDHPLVAVPLSNLVLLKTNQRQFDEAESLLREMLDLRKRVLGEEHPQYLIGLTRLAALLRQKGQWKDSEAQYRDAIARFEKTADRAFLDSARRNLASLLQDQGDYSEAESLYRVVLTTQEQRLGRKSLAFASTLSDLGTLHQDTGELSSARRAFEESLAIRREALGQDGPAVASSYALLGQLEVESGDLAAAEAHYRAALAIRSKSLGDQHVDTALGFSQLAEVYLLRNELEQAESAARRATEIHRTAASGVRPEADVSLRVLARVLEARKSYVDATDIFRESLALSIRRWPQGSVQIAIARRFLAHCLVLQSRFAEAEPLLAESLPMLEQVKSRHAADARRDLAEVRQARRGPG